MSKDAPDKTQTEVEAGPGEPGGSKTLSMGGCGQESQSPFGVETDKGHEVQQQIQ